MTALKLHKGILYSTSRVRESKTYNLKNRSEHDRTVLIEHPSRPTSRSQQGPAQGAEPETFTALR